MAKTIQKEVANAKLFDDGTILIENVRCSYPHLDKPYAKADKNGKMPEPAFSMTSLMPKATHKEAMLLIRDEVRRILAENKLKDIAADRKFIRDGDLTAKDTDAGHWIVAAREKTAPILRDENNRNVEQINALRKFYPGCFVSTLIRPWFQSNEWGKRINANLLAVQFRKDGEAFGEGRITDEDVDDVFGGVADDASGFDADNDDEL